MKVCSIDGCSKKHHSKGLCKWHYDTSRKSVKAARDYALKTTDKRKADLRAAQVKYATSHRDLLVANCTKYRETHGAEMVAHNAQLRAGPRATAWADSDKIIPIYEAAAFSNKSFGTKLEVDHVIPLRGELVSGLHVHNNLQLLDHFANKIKSDKFDPWTWVEPTRHAA